LKWRVDEQEISSEILSLMLLAATAAACAPTAAEAHSHVVCKRVSVHRTPRWTAKKKSLPLPAGLKRDPHSMP
jgi:hypothetical protein